ncbi:MAG: hypothetical protein OEQ90_09680 [Gammaproteobacteria bacterium]|nr:hypothetical protein [Gammaproteobacteria bacterium]
MKTAVLGVLGSTLFVGSGVLLADAPYIDPANDAQHFGDPLEELFWTPEQQVSGYRNMEKVSPARKVTAGGEPYPLPSNEVDLVGHVITDGCGVKGRLHPERR